MALQSLELILFSHFVAPYGRHKLLEYATFNAYLILFRHICEKTPLKKALG